MKPEISVIVPVYRVEQYLDQCIQSVLDQTYPHWELILVDDGSTDGSGGILDRYAKQDLRVRVFHRTNQGVCAARNFGIEQAQGEYLTFLDADDWLDPEYLQTMWDLHRSAQAEIVSTGYRESLHGQEFYTFAQPVVLTGKEAVGRMLRQEGLDSQPWGKLYPAGFWQQVRFPDAALGEDTNLTYRLLEKAEHVALTGKAQYQYRKRPDSATSARPSEKIMSYTREAGLAFEDLLQRYPEYRAQATDFYLKAVVYNYLVLSRTSGLSATLSSYLKTLKRELHRYRKDFYRSPCFSFQTKAAVTLSRLHLYGGMRQVLNLLKRSHKRW